MFFLNILIFLFCLKCRSTWESQVCFPGAYGPPCFWHLFKFKQLRWAARLLSPRNILYKNVLFSINYTNVHVLNIFINEKFIPLSVTSSVRITLHHSAHFSLAGFLINPLISKIKGNSLMISMAPSNSAAL